MSQTSSTLHTGKNMPHVGLGTWCSPKGTVGAAVEIALRNGYKHIDCAHIYGNEAEIGETFGKIFKDPNFPVKREDVFVTSKLWISSRRKEAVAKALDKTLQDLQLEYLDLYLIHLPISWNNTEKKMDFVPMSETWKALEEAVDQGKIRHIGVSNFNVQLISDILGYARIKPAVNQIERHPYLAQNGLVDFCQKNGIVITAYSPLGSPGAEDRSKAENEPRLMDEQLINDLAKKYYKSVAQVLIRWSVQDDVVVIPKSTNEERIKQNFAIWDFTLSKEDHQAITNLSKTKPYRYCDQKWTGFDIFQ